MNRFAILVVLVALAFIATPVEGQRLGNLETTEVDVAYGDNVTFSVAFSVERNATLKLEQAVDTGLNFDVEITRATIEVFNGTLTDNILQTDLSVDDYIAFFETDVYTNMSALIMFTFFNGTNITAQAVNINYQEPNENVMSNNIFLSNPWIPIASIIITVLLAWYFFAPDWTKPWKRREQHDEMPGYYPMDEGHGRGRFGPGKGNQGGDSDDFF